TGTIEVRPASEIAGMKVKVYTKEGHESVYHSKHIELMPGEYHLEICLPDGKVVHRESKVEFHQTNVIPVSFAQATDTVTQAIPAKKRRWWQFWRYFSDDANSASKDNSNDSQ